MKPRRRRCGTANKHLQSRAFAWAGWALVLDSAAEALDPLPHRPPQHTQATGVAAKAPRHAPCQKCLVRRLRWCRFLLPVPRRSVLDVFRPLSNARLFASDLLLLPVLPVLAWV